MNIRETALKYLEHRPRTEAEMRSHLSTKGFESNDIEQTVSELIELNYINDSEYVIAYINYGFSKDKGIKLIRYELYDKGVSDSVIEDGLFQYGEEYGYDFEKNEKERARIIAEKSLVDVSLVDEKIIGKIARKLSSKGYETNTIWSVIDEIKKNNESVE